MGGLHSRVLKISPHLGRLIVMLLVGADGILSESALDLVAPLVAAIVVKVSELGETAMVRVALKGKSLSSPMEDSRNDDLMTHRDVTGSALKATDRLDALLDVVLLTLLRLN